MSIANQGNYHAVPRIVMFSENDTLK